MPKKPLEGIKVTDFSWVWAAPISTKTLADLGAEVIRIESRSRPDIIRTVPPFKDDTPGLDRASDWNQLNTGKLSVALNLGKPKGVEIAKRFVARADIVVENFAGGVIAKFGLAYEDLKKVKPDIIMLSSCMMGQTGPYAAQAAFGLQLTSMAGFCQVTGWPDRLPAWLSAHTDYIAPHFNLVAILAALDYRRRTGKGQYLDASQYENGIHFLAPLALDYAVNQRIAGRMGNRSSYAAPHGVYRCRGEDRWCAIAVFSDEEWQGFGQAIGSPAWVNDTKFSTLLARKENEDELEQLVEEWTANQSAEEVMTIMQAAGVSAGVVQTAEDLMENDPQLKHRHFFWEVDHSEIGKYRAPGPSFVLSKSPYELRSAPRLGEHNEYALKEFLGIADEEIAELVIEGVLE